jgi:hypothetical protein
MGKKSGGIVSWATPALAALLVGCWPAPPPVVAPKADATLEYGERNKDCAESAAEISKSPGWYGSKKKKNVTVLSMHYYNLEHRRCYVQVWKFTFAKQGSDLPSDYTILYDTSEHDYIASATASDAQAAGLYCNVKGTPLNCSAANAFIKDRMQKHYLELPSRR